MHAHGPVYIAIESVGRGTQKTVPKRHRGPQVSALDRVSDGRIDGIPQMAAIREGFAFRFRPERVRDESGSVRERVIGPGVSQGTRAKQAKRKHAPFVRVSIHVSLTSVQSVGATCRAGFRATTGRRLSGTSKSVKYLYAFAVFRTDIRRAAREILGDAFLSTGK